MAEQLGLFAPRRDVAPAGCPRVPGPLCRDGREGRCPGGARCEELGEQEAARLTQVCTGAKKSAVEARTPPLPPGGRGGGHGDGSTAGSAPESASVPNGANCQRRSHAPRCQDCPGGEACQEKHTARIQHADAELARRRAAGEPVERWGTSAADFAGVVDQEAAERCHECQQPPEAGAQLYVCQLCDQLVCTSCSTDGSGDGGICDSCIREADRDTEHPLTPEELAPLSAADLGVSEFGTGQAPAPRPPHGCGTICQDARDGKCPGKEKCDEMGPSAPACGACGSTTGAVFYTGGPLAGLRRCWPCARPVLTTMEVHDG